MKKKIIFFDIDGTLGIQGKSHISEIPECSWEALRRLKANGHILAVCTGRQPSYAKLLFDDFFDSIVCLRGNFVTYKNEVIYANYINEERFRSVYDRLINKNVTFAMVGNDEVTVFNGDKDMEKIFEGSKIYFPEEFEYHKACMMDFIFKSKEKYEECLPILDDMVLNYHYDPNCSADVSFKDADKDIGMDKLLNYLQIDKEDAIAFGDGLSDMSMLEYAGIGVAMGNGHPKLKEMADLVTTNVEDNGILNACEKLNLI